MAIKQADTTRPVKLSEQEMVELRVVADARVKELASHLPTSVVYAMPIYSALSKLEFALDYFKAPERIAAKVEAAQTNTPQITPGMAGLIQAQNALAQNCCPKCGWRVRQNSSMTGWVQCGQFGAVGFRDDSNIPSCDWQGFTV